METPKPTPYIEQFLTTFSDNALQHLHAAAEMNIMPYRDSGRCLVARHQLGYSVAKHEHPVAAYAEHEYSSFVDSKPLLPLIEREQARRKPPVKKVEEEELVAV